jgi:Putative prokaryotic signal transducing protein
MSLVTVFTSFSPAEAQLIRSRLEAANFHAVVMHELSALSIDGYSMAAGGIRVQVPASEAADARELLTAEDAPPESDTKDTEGSPE